MLFHRNLVVTLVFLAVMILALGMAASRVFGKDLFDPQVYCKANVCQKGPSLYDPPILNQSWKPFQSSELLVWGADACLGYFLTKDKSAWNGGVVNDEVDDLHGLYLILGEFSARIHIYDWPYDTDNSPYAGYGVFQCQNTRWPEHLLETIDKEEIHRWTEFRLSKTDGWIGRMEDWDARQVGTFRNDALSLTVEIRNSVGRMIVDFKADYLGPPILYNELY